jgi:uncharacterized protein YkwD
MANATRALAAALWAAALACRTPAPPRAAATPSNVPARAPAARDAPRVEDPAAPADDRAYGDDAAPPLRPEEAASLAAVRAELSRGSPPRVSGALVRAARELARRAAGGSLAPLEQASRRSALTAGHAYDPSPSAFLVRGSADQLPSAVAELGFPRRATHVGVGSATVDGAVLVVVLASERKARLGAFPTAVPVGTAAPLSGVLEAGLSRARVYITVPSGAVREADVTGGAAAFRASLGFPARGRYVVEVVGQGEGGPEVAALLEVTAGEAPAAPAAASRARAAEPADRAAAEAGVVRAINGLRLARGLDPLRATTALTEAARRHSERMLAEGRIAHVLPGSGEFVDRLRQAEVPYRRAYENVARGGTTLAAHEAAEESPAHRENLLQAGATRVGVGIARGTLPSGLPVVYLTEILVEPAVDGSEDRVAPEVRVREAIWRERARLRVAPLTLDPTLDALAQETADAMRAADAPDASGLDDRALALRRGLAAVDVFVGSAPSDAIRSANLRDVRFRKVGVGVAVGDSRRYGAGRLFIAVVYTD